MLKATPAAEGANRFIYIEASNEMRDQQGEIVLSKALAESADYYLRYGNIDIDHFTQIGAKKGIPNYDAYEIGRPVSVRVENGKTFVKGQIFTGEGRAAERANLFWSSLTEINPPQRWYPSVGGAISGKSAIEDPATGRKVPVVTGVRWTNVGMSRTPVNASVPTASTAAFGPLAKSWEAALMFKGMEAGYGSDSATLTGGAALRIQSLGDDSPYKKFRDQFAAAIQRGEVKEMTQPGMTRAAQERFDFSAAAAAEFVERFLSDLQAGLKEKR